MTRPPEAPDWPWLEARAAGPDLMRGAALGAVAERVDGGLAVLALPWGRWAPGEDGRPLRVPSGMPVALAGWWTARLAEAGVTAVAPVALAAAMAGAEPRTLPFDAPAWATWELPLLASAALVVVPPVVGWRRSRGVWRTVRAGVDLGLGVALLSRQELIEPAAPAPDLRLHSGLDLIDHGLDGPEGAR